MFFYNNLPGDRYILIYTLVNMERAISALVILVFIGISYAKDNFESGKISQRAVTIATYALCNFANIGSIGITIGGIAGIAPNRQHDLARMGVRSMIGGLLAGFITACVAGMLI